jgi:hypothetical protein
LLQFAEKHGLKCEADEARAHVAGLNALKGER